MSHIYHPDLAERLTSRAGSGVGVLVDGCPSCESAIEHPTNLDQMHCAALWREMVRVEHDGGGAYRSRADARAARSMYELAVCLERYTKTDPWAMFTEAPWGPESVQAGGR